MLSRYCLLLGSNCFIALLVVGKDRLGRDKFFSEFEY